MKTVYILLFIMMGTSCSKNQHIASTNITDDAYENELNELDFNANKYNELEEHQTH